MNLYIYIYINHINKNTYISLVGFLTVWSSASSGRSWTTRVNMSCTCAGVWGSGNLLNLHRGMRFRTRGKDSVEHIRGFEIVVYGNRGTLLIRNPSPP